MPSKKKKYNARFPAGRIKKIMQTDEEVGKVAQAVPVIISRTLELFVESLLSKSMQITLARNAKTLTPSHMKQCILSEHRFDFLKDLVKDIPDASIQEDNENNAIFEESLRQNTEGESDIPSHSRRKQLETSVKETLRMKIEGDSQAGHSRKRSASSNIIVPVGPPTGSIMYTEQSTSTSRTPVIRYGPNITQTENTKRNFSVNNLIGNKNDESVLYIDDEDEDDFPSSSSSKATSTVTSKVVISDDVPPLIPLSHKYGQNSGDNLTIDEDYDN